jgi:hypothetical protein
LSACPREITKDIKKFFIRPTLFEPYEAKKDKHNIVLKTSSNRHSRSR